jgi:hypothetical protein
LHFTEISDAVSALADAEALLEADEVLDASAFLFLFWFSTIKAMQPAATAIAKTAIHKIFIFLFFVSFKAGSSYLLILLYIKMVKENRAQALFHSIPFGFFKVKFQESRHISSMPY